MKPGLHALAATALALALSPLANQAFAQSDAAPAPLKLPDLIKKLMPSVPSITVEVGGPADATLEAADPGSQLGKKPKKKHDGSHTGLGTGIVLDYDPVTHKAHIATNAHVVNNGKNVQSITVTFNDAKDKDTQTYKNVKLDGYDVESDLAVVEIPDVDPAHPLIPVSFADSDQLEIGMHGLAFGNPFGLSGSVTEGPISGMNRQTGDECSNDLQHAAPINPGNSGGPFFMADNNYMDQYGKLAGMNQAIIAPARQSAGIGLFIPANTIKKVTAAIIKDGKYKRGHLGLMLNLANGVDDPDADAPAAGTAAAEPGVVITGAPHRSPAGRAGLKADDRILSFAGTPVNTPAELLCRIEETAPGTAVDILYDRGTEKSLHVTATLDTEAEKVPPVEAAESEGLPPGMKIITGPDGKPEALMMPGPGGLTMMIPLTPDEIITGPDGKATALKIPGPHGSPMTVPITPDMLVQPSVPGAAPGAPPSAPGAAPPAAPSPAPAVPAPKLGEPV